MLGLGGFVTPLGTAMYRHITPGYLAKYYRLFRSDWIFGKRLLSCFQIFNQIEKAGETFFSTNYTFFSQPMTSSQLARLATRIFRILESGHMSKANKPPETCNKLNLSSKCKACRNKQRANCCERRKSWFRSINLNESTVLVCALFFLVLLDVCNVYAVFISFFLVCRVKGKDCPWEATVRTTMKKF